MRKIIGSILAALALLLGSALPGHAWGGHRHGGHHGYSPHHGYGGRHGFGGRYGVGPYGYGHRHGYLYGYSYAYPYSSRSEPATTRQQPAVNERSYWYYCESARAYHPYVQQCPEGWMRIVPPTTGGAP